MAETILQHWVFSRFALPFLLVFFIVFAILEKTKVLGEGKKQINALVAFVVGLITISIAYPVNVISNLILFLTVAIVVVFVTLLLWGFMISGEAKVENKAVKTALGVLAILAVVGAVFWATGLFGPLVETLFQQEWSYSFWINFLFVIVIAIALALALKSGSSSE